MKHLTIIAMFAAVAVWGFARTADAHPTFGCDSCHVVHHASDDDAVPLWNPQQTSTDLTDFYDSDTMDATVGVVDGASKLCLSCHDGTHDHVAGASEFTTLQHSHPVSIVYDDELATTLDGELVQPSSDPQKFNEILDTNSKMQCTSCHDVHATYAAAPNLRWEYENDFSGDMPQFNNVAFCRNCHEK